MFPPTRSDSVVSEHTVDITNRREGFTLDLKGNGTASINRVITGSTPPRVTSFVGLVTGQS